VHNELQNATPERVNWWLRSTTVSASIFYMVIGLAGSAYGRCTPTGKLQGNVLLDFDEDDPLLLVARMCLACTVTLAFPLLVIPARDILLRSWFDKAPPVENPHQSEPTENPASGASTISDSAEAALRERLLEFDNREHDDPQTSEQNIAADTSEGSQFQQHSFAVRLGTGILVLWSSAVVASCVKSIDVVWDLLGSSLSVILSYLIPCAAFIAIVGRSTADAGSGEDENKGAIFFAKAMIFVYLPLMLVSTGNAFVNTFFT
jgi:Transmembrane amino acid transporter protein